MNERDKEFLAYLQAKIGFYSIDKTVGDHYWARQALKHLRAAKTNFEKGCALAEKAKKGKVS